MTDSKNNSVTSNCSIAICGGIVVGNFTTYTQGGWGAPQHGNNPGTLLASKFTMVYPSGSVSIGSTYKLTFTDALAITNFLPHGSTPGQLAANATNPTTSLAGVFAGQVLALELKVDFSNKGILPAGLANLHVVSGPLAGQSVAQVLALANSVLGGAAPLSGMTVSDLNKGCRFDQQQLRQRYNEWRLPALRRKKHVVRPASAGRLRSLWRGAADPKVVDALSASDTIVCTPTVSSTDEALREELIRATGPQERRNQDRRDAGRV